MQIWLNGSFVDRDDARVSVFDAGFQHAVGLFETMLARNGTVFRARRHMERLRDSAQSLLLTERLQIHPLIEAVNLVVRKNDLDAARVRLTITGGNLNMLQGGGKGPVDPTILIVAQPPTAYPEAFFERGVRVMIADGRDNPFITSAGHKTLSYWPRIQALQLAAAKQAGESLWFTVSNHLAGGSVSNIFLVKDGELLTPIARGEEERGSIASCVLPGVTRQAIIELAANEQTTVHRRMLDIDDLLGADEVFLTNSSWGVLPVTAVERETIGNGKVGELTGWLREAWKRAVERETLAPDEGEET